MNVYETRDIIRQLAPVRVHLSDGRTLEIPHADYCYFAKSALHLFKKEEDGMPGYLLDVVGYNSIASIEPLSPA